MKILIFMAASSLIYLNAGYAQSGMKYCDLVVTQPFFKNYYAELHTETNKTKGDCILRDANGKKIKFAATADALDFVVKQGFELVSTYNDHSTIHFLLKKTEK